MTRPPLVIIVCGGRRYRDWDKVRDTLDDLAIIHGVARVKHGYSAGADALADQWADLRRISQRRYPANWDLHGPSAGPIRNQEMLDDKPTDLVVAFPGGRGTADMVRRARAANIPVIEVKP